MPAQYKLEPSMRLKLYVSSLCLSDMLIAILFPRIYTENDGIENVSSSEIQHSFAQSVNAQSVSKESYHQFTCSYRDKHISCTKDSFVNGH